MAKAYNIIRTLADLAGFKIYYIVKAVDDNGNVGPASSQVSGTPQGDLPPAAPSNLSITEKETSLELAWSSNHEADIAGYNVYRGTSSGSHSTRMNTALVSSGWFADATAGAGQTYYYVVTAVDSAGHESGFSNEVSGKIGQGVVKITAPTTNNPITIDFSSETMSAENAFNTNTNIYGVTNAVIKIEFTNLQRVLSKVHLEIKNSDTGEPVYTAEEWKPVESDPYFTWSGKYKNNNHCVPDGYYDAKVYVSDSLFSSYAETVNPRSIQVTGCDGVKITKAFNLKCDNLTGAYACGNSFIAKNDNSGDFIHFYATANYGSMDLSNKITWTCVDTPNDGVDSGSCGNDSTGSGSIFSFSPNPPPAPAGRTGPLSYTVTARVTINKKTYEETKIVTQDKIDELRQEYEDMDGRTSKVRTDFDTDAADVSYPRLLDSPDIESDRHEKWHILRLHNLNQHARDVDNNYSGNLRVTAGYRCPRGNATAGGVPTSNHQDGVALDFNQQDSQKNYDAFTAAYNAGARKDSYLKASKGDYYITFFWYEQYIPDASELNTQYPGYVYDQGHVAWP